MLKSMGQKVNTPMPQYLKVEPMGWGGEMLQCCEWMGVAMKKACGIASMIFFAASPFLEDTIIQEVFLKAEGLSPKTQAL